VFLAWGSIETTYFKNGSSWNQAGEGGGVEALGTKKTWEIFFRRFTGRFLNRNHEVLVSFKPTGWRIGRVARRCIRFEKPCNRRSLHPVGLPGAVSMRHSQQPIETIAATVAPMEQPVTTTEPILPISFAIYQRADLIRWDLFSVELAITIGFRVKKFWKFVRIFNVFKCFTGSADFHQAIGLRARAEMKDGFVTKTPF
jgi:hypothetical protein